MNHDRAIILVDHGSRREAANRHLEGLAALVADQRTDWVIRIAHLELAEPSVPAFAVLAASALSSDPR